MEAMRQSWTDDRMDDLARHVDAGFAQARVDLGSTREELRREIKGLRSEVKAQGDEMRGGIETQSDKLRAETKALGQELRSEINARFDIVDRRFDSLNAVIVESQRTMIQLCGGLCFALIAAVATLVVAVL